MNSLFYNKRQHTEQQFQRLIQFSYPLCSRLWSQFKGNVGFGETYWGIPYSNAKSSIDMELYLPQTPCQAENINQLNEKLKCHIMKIALTNKALSKLYHSSYQKEIFLFKVLKYLHPKS